MEEIVAQIFSKFAYQPMLVYSAICGFMLLSAFGLPIPEEIVLISAGLVGYMSLHPDKYPPHGPDAQPVNIYVLATVAFVAVMCADFLIYFLGKRFGPKLFKTRFFARMMTEKTLKKVQRWMWEYGSWAVFVFRFTPGVRFPGHLTCGAMGIPAWKFIGVDWLAAGFSVPTQVLLVSFYGEFILQYFTRFKIYFFSIIAIAALGYFVYRYINNKRELAAINAAQNAKNSPLAESKVSGESAQR